MCLLQPGGGCKQQFLHIPNPSDHQEDEATFGSRPSDAADTQMLCVVCVCSLCQGKTKRHGLTPLQTKWYERRILQ
eukprot:5954308-Amphidinium_carterae.1